MSNKALWYFFGKGYANHYPYIISITIVPLVMSIILYLALLSSHPTHLDTAKIFEFPAFPTKMLDYATAANAKMFAFYPDTPQVRAIAEKFLRKIKVTTNVDFIPQNQLQQALLSIEAANIAPKFDSQYQVLAENLDKSIDNFDIQSFLEKKQDYKQTMLNNLSASQVGYLFLIDIDVSNLNINYSVYSDDKAIIRYHRENVDYVCANFSQYTEAYSWSCYGYSIQNGIESAIFEEVTGATVNLKLGQLPYKSPTPVKLYLRGSFMVLCIQPFVLIFTIFIVQKFRANSFVIIKRLGVSVLEFWLINLIFAFILNYVSLVVLYVFTAYVLKILPFAAYTPALIFLYAIPVAFSFAVMAIFFTVIIYSHNIQIIITIILSLLVTQFPVLLVQMGYTMRSLWDPAVFPQILSHICCVVIPMLACHGLVEYLIQILPQSFINLTTFPDSLQLRDLSYLRQKWQDIPMQYAINQQETYFLPPIWYFYILIPVQALFYLVLSIYIAEIKHEKKQSGIVCYFLCHKRFYKKKQLDRHSLGLKPINNSHSTTPASENSVNIVQQLDISEQTPVLEIKNLNKTFKKLKVLQNFNLTLHESEVIGIIGESGAGKSTLLNIIADYLKPDKAPDSVIRFLNFNLMDSFDRKWARKYIAICPQDKENIFDFFTISDNIKLLKLFKSDCFGDQVVNELLDKLALKKAVNKTFQQLSGGMQRRFGLLMSLLQKPTLLLLDEMTANVDPYLKRNIWDALQFYRSIHKCAIIITSHDSAEMLNVANKIIFLKNGINMLQGTLSEIYNDVDQIEIQVNRQDAKKMILLLKQCNQQIISIDHQKTQKIIGIKMYNIEQIMQLTQFLDSCDLDYKLNTIAVNDLLFKQGEKTPKTNPSQTENLIESSNFQVSQTNLEEIEKSSQDILSQLNIEGQYKDNNKYLRQIYNYMKYAVQNTFYQAYRCYFLVVIISLILIFLFVILQLVINKSVFKSDESDSKYNYNQAFNESSDILNKYIQTCGKSVYDCLVQAQTIDQMTSCRPSLVPPNYAYSNGIQKYFDLLNFHSLQNNVITFGDGSMFLSDANDTYRSYIISNDYNIKNQSETINIGSILTTTIQNSYISSSLSQQQFDKMYDDNELGLYTRRISCNTTSFQCKSVPTFFAIHDIKQALGEFFQAQQQNVAEINYDDLTQEEIEAYQKQLFISIIDNDTVYVTLPYYYVNYMYSNTNLVFKDEKVIRTPYFKRAADDFNQKASQQPMIVNYNNDAITRFYAAKLRKKLRQNDESLYDLSQRVTLRANYISQPYFAENQGLRSEYQASNFTGELSFQFFYVFIVCILILVHVYQYNKNLEKRYISFVDGVSASIAKMMMAQIVIDFLTFTLKLYIILVVFLVLQPSEIIKTWQIWVIQPLLAIQIIAISYVICIILKKFSIITLYVGLNFVFQVIINAIIQPSQYIALALSLFLPGFYYITLLNKTALYLSYEGTDLIYGALLSFVEIAITLCVYHILMNKNKKKLSKSTDAFMENQILRAKNIHAYYSKKSPILDDFDLELFKNRTTCLIGANGCGKSTFIKCITGFEVKFQGEINVKARIGIVPQDDACFELLSVLENLKIMANFSQGVNYVEVLKQTNLYNERNQITKTLSGGQKRRLTIAMVLVTRPTLLVLDEVTVGLDYAMKQQVWNAILSLKDCAILAVTHDMHEIEALADDCKILSDGRIIVADEARNVMNGCHYSYVVTVFNCKQLNVNQIQAAIVEVQKNTCNCYLFPRQVKLFSIISCIHAAGLQQNEWVIESVQMESVFIEALTGKFQL